MKDQVTSTQKQQTPKNPSRFSGGWDEELLPDGTTTFHGGSYEDEELLGSNVTFHMTDGERMLRDDMQAHYDAIAEIRRREMHGEISHSDAEQQVESRLRSIGYIKQELRNRGIIV